MNGQVLQCFLNADLRSGHEGLAKLAKKYELDVSTLQPGEFLVFINSHRDRIKVYAASNVVAYYRAPAGGRVDLNTVREIPRVFMSKGRLDYDDALKVAIEKSLQRARKPGPLQVFHVMKRAGIA